MKPKATSQNFILDNTRHQNKFKRFLTTMVRSAFITTLTLCIIAIVSSTSATSVRAADNVPVDPQPEEVDSGDEAEPEGGMPEIEEPAPEEPTIDEPVAGQSAMQEEFLDNGEYENEDNNSPTEPEDVSDQTLGSVSNDEGSGSEGDIGGIDPGTPGEHKSDAEIGDALESTLTLEAGEPDTPKGEADSSRPRREEAPESDLVDAPAIEPEGPEGEYNIFGAAGAYYVSVPKSMSFKKLSNGDFETSEASYYTVNSVLDNTYRLSVRVSGINVDDTVELTNESGTVYRKVEVSTAASDIWQYRPDGTVLTVNGADGNGYGEELILEGPGKFKAKCKLSQFGDDVIHAGTWKGSILFTVSCTPDPGENPKALQEAAAAETGNPAGETHVENPPAPAQQQPPQETPVEPAPVEAVVPEEGSTESPGSIESEAPAGEQAETEEHEEPQDFVSDEGMDDAGIDENGDPVSESDNEPI